MVAIYLLAIPSLLDWKEPLDRARYPQNQKFPSATLCRMFWFLDNVVINKNAQNSILGRFWKSKISV